jgi:3-hydroxybutyryl-CoA dehydrogenase
MSERVMAVVGAGLMGAQIGAEYALGGFEVRLSNRGLESSRRAVARAVAALGHLGATGLAEPDSIAAAVRRLSALGSAAEACRGAELIVESLPEDMDAKAAALTEAVRAAPAAPICSNTSSLSVGELGRRLVAEERTIGTHYWNPPTLMPLVEVIPGPRTDPGLVARVEALLRSLGKEPVRAPDIPGFIWNRLQLALLREAVGMVQAGEAEPATIDLILRRGLGRRWSLIGPFQTVALGGPAVFEAVAGQLWPKLHDDVAPAAIGRLDLPPASPELRAARDESLARLLREDAGGAAKAPA